MGKRIDNTTCHCLKMRRSAENVIRFYDQVLQPSGITVRQYSLLKNIGENEGCSVRILAELTDLDRSTLARSLKPLMKAGLIEDSKEIGTRDSKLLLTRDGKDTCAFAAGLWQQAQREFEERLGAGQVEKLEEILLGLQNL